MLTLAALERAQRHLVLAGARPTDEGDHWVVRLHPDDVYDVEGDPRLVGVWRYADQDEPHQLFDAAYLEAPCGLRLYADDTVPSGVVFVFGSSAVAIVACTNSTRPAHDEVPRPSVTLIEARR